MYGIEVVVEWLNVVFVNGGEGVVGFSEPKQDGLAGTGGVVSRGLVGKDSLLEIFHKDVR